MEFPVRRVSAWLVAATVAAFTPACTDGSENNPPPDDSDAAVSGGADANDQPAQGPIIELTTNMGTIVVQLAEDKMPITTANFLTYIDSGFYDDTIVHRVIDDWVIQGGGYSSGLVPKGANPPINLETHADVGHVHGAISMARTNDPNSATSQWFIVDWPATGTPPQPPQLDGQYAAFGVMIEGFDVLAAMTQVATGTNSGLTDVPTTEIVITRAERR